MKNDLELHKLSIVPFLIIIKNNRKKKKIINCNEYFIIFPTKQ